MTEEAGRPGRRQRSLHCNPAEQAMTRERAAAAGKTVSRYVVELALADDPDRHPLVLTEEEQVALRDVGGNHGPKPATRRTDFLTGFAIPGGSPVRPMATAVEMCRGGRGAASTAECHCVVVPAAEEAVGAA